MKALFRINLIWLLILPTIASADETCYPAGGVAGIVIATIVVTVVVIGLSLSAAWKFWKNKKVRRKRPENNLKSSSEKAPGDFAFDNPYFRDQEDDEADTGKHGKTRSSINNKSPLRSSKQSDLSTKGKKGRSGKGHFIFGGGQGKKQRAMDDSCLAVEPERTVVSLRGHDFTGLGFNICGNMRDGILVKDVLHRGPASESGKIKAGDRIISVTVSFTNIVYEDALTILSYASPYDVQLELERMAASDKARNAIVVGESPSGSKRLGSYSFSSSGPKLFHPLYRSQSIDDLTQIDRDTFPSHHGFGPRRSQSVGVAAHKLASHFKNSDSKLVEEEKKKDCRNSASASVILSTTGSLNEKMLANVMTDGSLHTKQGGLLHWEKRFEDTLENDDSAGLESSKKKHISSTSSSNDDSMDEVITSEYKSKTKGGTTDKHKLSRQRPEDLQKSYTKHSQSITDMKTAAQIHHNDNSKDKRTSSTSENTGETWQLNKSVRSNADSDIDTPESFPWNKSQSKMLAAEKSQADLKRNYEKKCNKNFHQNCEGDSDVSGDSLEGSRKHRGKQTKKHKTSQRDLTHLEETNSHTNTGHGNKNASNYESENNSNSSYQQKVGKKALNESCANGAKYQTHSERNQNSLQSEYTNCSITELSNKEKKIERTILNTAHSPRLSVRSSKPKCDSNENLHSKSGNYSNSIQMQNSPTVTTKSYDRTDNYERQNQNCSRTQNYLVSNNINSPKNEMDDRNRAPAHQHQQRYQKQSQSRQISDEHDMPISDTRNGPQVAGYTQILRKTVSPAGMFTQINPFQQPSRMKNHNINPLSKSWVAKEHSKSSLPMNGSDYRYNAQYAKNTQNVPITSTDSATERSRNRINVNTGDNQAYAQKLSDGSHSKTVLISTYDQSSSTPNFRQMRN